MFTGIHPSIKSALFKCRMEAARNKHLHSQAKGIVYAVGEYFRKEKEMGGPVLNVTMAVARQARAVNLSECTCKRINKEGNISRALFTDKENENSHENNVASQPVFHSPRKRKRPTPIADIMDDFNKSLLRRIVRGIYVKSMIPTIDMIHAAAVKEMGYPGCKESLRKALHTIGYKYSHRYITTCRPIYNAIQHN